MCQVYGQKNDGKEKGRRVEEDEGRVRNEMEKFRRNEALFLLVLSSI